MNSGPALPNVGPGPDTLALAELEAEFAVLLLHRDFYCSNCRQQVRRVKSRYEEFEERDAEVVSVLPESPETAEEWQKQYHLPFPVLADAEKRLARQYDQPTRYGLFGRLHDVIGRMPAALVLDLRWSEPTETFAHRGDSKTDRPRIDELLLAIDDAAAVAEDSTRAEREAAARAVADGATGGSVPPETQSSPEPAGPPDPGEADTPPETGEAGVPDEGADAPAPSDEEGANPPAPSDEGAELVEDDPAPTVPSLPVPDGVDLPADIELRWATEDDAMPVIRVLHGALLEIDGSTVRRAVDRGDVIVAEADGWVIGTLVLEDNHVDALAVRRERRTEGIGSALVETAVAVIGGPVTADFRAGVRGFWRDLGFEIEREGDRFYGIRNR